MKVPQEALNRLNQIAQEADEASVLASRTVEQIRTIDRSTMSIKDPDEMNAALAEIERLKSAQTQHQQRSRELSAVASALNHWLRSLPAGVSLELAPPTSVDLLKGETVMDAVNRFRDEINSLQSERSSVQRARPPKADIKRQVEAYIAERARRGAPRIKIADGLEVDFAPATFEAGTVRHVVDVLCWIDPSKVQKRIENEIDAMPDHGNSMTADERTKRLAEIDGELDRLERQEEAAIRLAEEAGHKAIARRQHASPAAILGVRVKTDKASRSRAA